jgi:aspartate kinase
MTAPVVMKFGGTSVEDAAAFERVARIVARRPDIPRVVVVSAMAKFTDALVLAMRAAIGGDPDGAAAAVEPHLARHGDVCRALVSADERAEMAEVFGEARRKLTELLRVSAEHPGTRAALHDEVVSYGERLSSRLLAAVLRACGVPARWVDARTCIRTTAVHTRAEPLQPQTREATRREVLPALDAGEVAVLGGFIGAAEDGATTTLGRGGSDYTAALVGAALDAGAIEIWTDVTGFLTADPRVVGEKARRIPRLSYAEAAELAFFGAKVLHPRTIQPAVERSIPVLVLNSREPDAGGTTIEAGSAPSPRAVKAIAQKTGVTLVHVTAARMLGAYGFLRALFEVFERHRTAVDVVATSEVSVSASIDEEPSPELIAELERLGTVQVEPGNAIACVVGEGLREAAGVAGQVFDAIRDVNVRMISQGASRINLTFVVEASRARETVRRLHAAFFESGED